MWEDPAIVAESPQGSDEDSEDEEISTFGPGPIGPALRPGSALFLLYRGGLIWPLSPLQTPHTGPQWRLSGLSAAVRAHLGECFFCAVCCVQIELR